MNENDNFLVKTAKVRDIFLIYLQSYLLHSWLINFYTNWVTDWVINGKQDQRGVWLLNPEGTHSSGRKAFTYPLMQWLIFLPQGIPRLVSAIIKLTYCLRSLDQLL